MKDRKIKRIYIFILILLSIFIIGISVLIPLGVTQYNNDVNSDKEEFDSLATTYVGFVSSSILGTIETTGDALRELYVVNPRLSRDQHLLSSQIILSGALRITAFGNIQPVLEESRKQTELSASIYFGKNLTIRDFDQTKSPTRSVYYPVLMVSPIATNEDMLLLDMNTSPTKDSFFEAIDSNQTTISHTQQSTTRYPSHVLFYPYYNTSSSFCDSNVTNCSSSFLGCTTLTFTLQLTLIQRMRTVTTREAGYFVYDDRDGSFVAGMCGNSDVWRMCTLESQQITRTATRSIRIANAKWTVHVVQLGVLNEFTYFYAFAIGIPVLFVIMLVFSVALFLLNRKIRTIEMLAEQSREQQVSKERFIHYIFHEIRVPFQTIKLGLLNLKKSFDIDSKEYETWNAINNSIEHASRILNDMLDIGKMENGKFTLQNQFTNILPSLNLMLSGYESIISNKNLEFNVNIHPNVSDTMFNCDIGRLSQCINNLLSNATKFTHKGSIDFNFGVTDKIYVDDIEYWTVEIVVKDTGVGIKECDQSKLFVPYQQIMNDSKEVGTGLGLVIIQNICRMYKGDVYFESEYGKGSKFWCVIPLEVRKKTESEMNTTSYELSEISEETLKLRVLVVDDNKNNCQIFGEFLKSIGFKNVDFALNGVKALDMIDKNEIYDLIFIDYNMPEMDGIECSKEIRKRNNEYSPYITMVTGAYLDHLKAKESGIDTILQKPLDVSKLNDVIKKASQIIISNRNV